MREVSFHMDITEPSEWALNRNRVNFLMVTHVTCYNVIEQY